MVYSFQLRPAKYKGGEEFFHSPKIPKTRSGYPVDFGSSLYDGKILKRYFAVSFLPDWTRIGIRWVPELDWVNKSRVGIRATSFPATAKSFSLSHILFILDRIISLKFRATRIPATAATENYKPL